MKRAMLILAGAAVGAWSVSLALAEEPAKEIPKDKQTKLLERFGDDGIDADGDGELTVEEVMTFFSSRSPGDRPGPHARRGHHGRKGGPGSRGPGKGERFERMNRVLEHLDRLSAEAPPDDLPAERIERIDTDGDGEVSSAEWSAHTEDMRERLLSRLLQAVPEIDSDEDGTISAAELEAFKAQRTEQMRARVLEKHPEVDADGDGTLSDEEYAAFKKTRMTERRARILERFPEADADGDGELSDAEMKEFRKSKGGRHGPGKHGRGHGKKGPGGKSV